MFFYGYQICKYMRDCYGKKNHDNKPDSSVNNTFVKFGHKDKFMQKIYKIVVIGNCGSGKSVLLNRIINNAYERPGLTIGVDFYSLQYKNVKLQIWDTTGRVYYTPRASYYENINLVIVCGCIKDGADGFIEWIKEALKWELKDIPIICVETKIDLIKDGGVASKKIKKQILQKYRILNYFRVSAKTGKGVNDLKNYLLRHFCKHLCWALSWQEKALLCFALTCKSALLQIKEIAEGDFSNTVYAIPKWPSGVIRYMLSFLGKKSNCQSIVKNTPSLNKVIASLKKSIAK